MLIAISEDQANDIREWCAEQLESNIEIEYAERLRDLIQTIDEALDLDPDCDATEFDIDPY